MTDIEQAFKVGQIRPNMTITLYRRAVVTCLHDIVKS